MLNVYLPHPIWFGLAFLMTTFTLRRQQRQAQYFTEDLGSDVGLDLILVPGGSFLMGSPETELERQEGESPQHPVTVPTFFMGRYPVTQAQWKVVAALPSNSKRKLKSDPSRFKDDHRPVEQVSWHDAVEFCERLSRKTGREYRLPSEAEWEYACRAGTITPFHVGETITADLANYDGDGTYGQSGYGFRRGGTTIVGGFPPNPFGLCDLHGNVWEWCLDHWHEHYEGAPSDGSAWLTGGANQYRMLRGGSWDSYPQNCRSAFRYWDYPDNTFDPFSFRVVCAMP